MLGPSAGPKVRGQIRYSISVALGGAQDAESLLGLEPREAWVEQGRERESESEQGQALSFQKVFKGLGTQS